jgi:ABC-2 type transport system permease protein
MSRHLSAELLKQRTTLTTLSLLLAMTALVGLAVAMHVFAAAPETLATRADQLKVFEAGTRIGMIFAGLVGALAITAEIRYGTIGPAFLVTPRRTPVLAAKLAVSMLVGAGFGLLAEALMVAAATAGFSARGISSQLSGGDYLQLLAGGASAAALWAAIGLGVGALVRNQVPTVVGLLAWTMLIETLLRGFVPDVGRLAPEAAGLALVGKTADELLNPAAGAAALLLYTTAACAAGWLATLLRDVA